MTETPRALVQDIGDTEIQYLRYKGAGTGPTVIMLHATGFLPWLWHPLARELAGDYAVIAPYFCNHREVDPERGWLSWRQIAEDLYVLCERLEIEDTLLVGHSMGGTVLTLAHALLGLPARKLVLIEPIFLPRQIYEVQLEVENHPLASKSIRRRAHWADRDEAREYLRSKPLFADWDDEMLELYIREGMQASDENGLTLTCSPQREAALFLGSNACDPWPLLPQVKCPVLVVEGETTENKEFINYPDVARHFPNGSYQEVPGAGHLVPMEKPALTLDIIRGFFGS